jgi:hypothetical protein
MEQAQTQFHLAQLNIARLRAAKTDPLVKPFMDLIPIINARAEVAPGYVWRLRDGETGGATNIRLTDDERLIVNLSVWESVETLSQFTYAADHLEPFRRRGEWFEKMDQAYLVLWWVQAGSVPTLEEAHQRLEHLRQHGPTPHAFTFKQRFPAPPQAASQAPISRLRGE